MRFHKILWPQFDIEGINYFARTHNMSVYKEHFSALELHTLAILHFEFLWVYLKAKVLVQVHLKLI